MVSFRPLLGLDSSLSLQRRHLACRCLLLVLLLCKSSNSFGIDDYLLEAQQLPTVGPSLAAPVFASFAPGELDAFFVLEQHASRIRRYDLSTGVLTSFLDLPDVPASAGGERGLVGFAFHPNYATNGKLYVHEYDGANVNIIELTHESGSPTVDIGTARTILTFSHGVSGASPDSHAAGWIGFSPTDGYLYIPTGDGGAGTCELCGTPSQDLNDLQGKLLRIDVNGDDFPEDPLKNYTIPGDNPFVAGGGGEPEIFAYGLRHAWRAGFDRQTGDLYLGDVGSNHFEEINLVPAVGPSGLNFGWRAREGDSDTPQFPDPAPMNAVDPLYFYPNDPGSSAVTGGLVYRGTKMPGLQGHYLFADFDKGTMATFNAAGGTVSDFVDRTSETGGFSSVVAFFEDPSGELFFMRRSNTNSLYKIIGYLRGDFTRDGFVDEFDLAKWQGDFAHNGDSDADGDGDSDGKDFLIWQRQFGASTILSTSTAIPEPASLLLLTVVMLGLTARRSKKAFIATLKYPN